MGDLVILESVLELEYFQFDNNPPGICRLFRRSDRECRGMSGPRGKLVGSCLSGLLNMTLTESTEDKSEEPEDADHDSQFQERQSVKSWRRLYDMNKRTKRCTAHYAAATLIYVEFLQVTYDKSNMNLPLEKQRTLNICRHCCF